MRLSIVALCAVLASPALANAQDRTCKIVRLVVTCSGIDVGTTPAQAAALLKPYETKFVNVLIPDGPPVVTRHDTDTEFIQPRKKFGESPWWWSELYDAWWYEPWVAKPWNLEPHPEPLLWDLDRRLARRYWW